MPTTASGWSAGEDYYAYREAGMSSAYFGIVVYAPDRLAGHAKRSEPV